MIDGNGRVIVQAALSLTLQPDLVPREAIEQADRARWSYCRPSVMIACAAAIKLNRFIDAYLVIGRFIDPEVLAEIQRTEMAVAQYRRLEQSREGILITFVMIFIIVALLLLLAAVWMGLTLATHISRPISGLIAAAERVRHGDLSVRVKPTTTIAEFGMVGRAFNRMTSQLQSQQEGLLLVNRDLDERRRFTEAVLSGVSAGVIGLDAHATITLPNRSASELLGLDLRCCAGNPARGSGARDGRVDQQRGRTAGLLMAIGDQTYPGGTSPHSYGSRCRREVAGRGARLCGDLRRHNGVGHGRTEGRVGRRRPTHRP